MREQKKFEPNLSLYLLIKKHIYYFCWKIITRAKFCFNFFNNKLINGWKKKGQKTFFVNVDLGAWTCERERSPLVLQCFITCGFEHLKTFIM